MSNLPKGIWYEKSRNRYRVRLYRNQTPYLGGYYKTIPEALHALAQLKQDLEEIAPTPRRKKHQKKAFGCSMHDLINSALQEIDLKET